MKSYIVIILSIVLTLLSFSCTKCDQTLLSDGQSIVKCPGKFYSLNLYDDGAMRDYQFEGFAKPKSDPPVLDLISDLSLGLLSNPTNIHPSSPIMMDAFDAINEIYAVELFPNSAINPYLFMYDSKTNQTKEVACDDAFFSPVYNQAKLYGVFAINDGGTFVYRVREINTSTGAVTQLHEKVFASTTDVNNIEFTSCGNENGTIYFLSNTVLIVYDIATNSSNFHDIDKSPDVNLRGFYQGLEFRQSDQGLLAIKGHKTNANLCELVQIVPNDSGAVVNSLFDIGTNLTANNNTCIATTFYSTAFSNCDNIYYISAVDDSSTLNKSFLIDIDLNNNTILSQEVPGFIGSIELQEN